jgi:hypothetical protein
MRKLCLLGVGAFLVVGGCSMDPMVYRIASNYVPVEEAGNSWEYEISTGGTSVVSIEGEGAILGRDCLLVLVNFENTYWYRDEDQFDMYVKTNYLYNEEFTIEERWAKHLVLPLVLGNTWSDQFEKTTLVYGQPVTRRTMMNARVTAIQDLVLPAGKFEQCYVVRLETIGVTETPYGNGWVDSLFVEEYYAPDVGLVRSVDLLTGEEESLTSYTVK